MRTWKEEIRLYFKDKTNIVVFTVLIIAIVYAALVRSINLGELAYWGDDGQTVLGTLGVVEHGYPMLPSGNIMYHSLFSFYLRAIPVILMGLNEVALRLPSLIFGVLIIPLVFLFVKDLVNKYAGLLASVIISFNIWQIEYSREIRYYQEFQFFYLLSAYLFYWGFFKNNKGCKIASIIFILISIQTNHLGVTLLFLFIPLLIYKKFKGFFKKDIIIAFIVVLVIVAASIFHRMFFWKAGLSFYDANIAADITNPILRLLSKIFAPYVPFYSRIFSVLFPTMFYMVFYGWILVVIYTFIPQIRSSDEDLINIYNSKKSNYSIKFPFNLFFLYFLFFSNTVFNGIGYMNTQQRYIFHVNTIFIAIFCYIVFDIARLATLGIKTLYKRIFSNKRNTKQTIITGLVYFVSVFAIFIFTVNWINPIANFNVAFRKNGDPVDGRFSVSNTFNFHHDPKIAGQYIAENKKEGDLVIATDLLNPYGYTRQIDYWLWTSTTFNTWQPFIYKDWGVYEEFYNVPVIRDYYQFLEVLNRNADKNIWIITSNSIRVRGHISAEVADFILRQEQYLKASGDDGVCSAYLFPKISDDTRGYQYPAGEENIIKIPENIGIDKPQKVFPFLLSDKENEKYLFYGWSSMQSDGTWMNNNNAVLLLDFNEKNDYILNFEIMPLFSTEQPQELKIIFNGTEVGFVKFKDMSTLNYAVKINKELMNTDNYNTIELRSKYLLSPKTLRINEDSRYLTVYVKKILFTSQ